jgi:hypothetical protein
MRHLLLSVLLFSAGVCLAQSGFEVTGETRYLYTKVRQVIGVSYRFNKSIHNIHVGYDRAFSPDKRNVGVGYQYSYTLENGFGIDANAYGRFGELRTGTKTFQGFAAVCLGSFVLEEAVGIHYDVKKHFLKDRLSITPFVRISFAQGFDQVQELPYSTVGYKCETPLRDVSLPYIGLRTSFSL